MTTSQQLLQRAEKLHSGDAKFDAEHRAYCRMFDELIKTHQNQWVAIHHGQVIDADDDRDALIDRVWEQYGYDQSIYFQQVVPGGLRVVTARL
jgi:hypothetical protein